MKKQNTPQAPGPVSKAQLKKYASLHQKKFRSRYSLYVAEGERTVRQLLSRSEPGIEAILLAPAFEADETLLKTCAIKQVPVMRCTAEEFARLSDTQQPQGILAVCRQPDFGLFDAFVPMPGALLLALDDLRDPGNLGTIYRTAAWFGASALLLGTGCADLYNPKVTRSTSGATGTLPVWEGNMPEMLEALAGKGCDILLLDLNPQARTLQDAAEARSRIKQESRSPLVLVTGNEAHGVSDALRSRYPAVYIPGMAGQVESLNAATSTAIALYGLSRFSQK